MDTLSLRLFVKAAEMRNISGAGRTLGLAPAVASARLAKLETTLGADLLHRSTRKVALSAEGEAFLPYAREMLAQEDAGLAALGQGQPTVSGRLRFAAPSTFAQMYIMSLLPQFVALYPEVELDLRLSDIQTDLIEGSFDLALRNQAIADSSLRARKLADDTRILCAAPEYLTRHGTPMVPANLAAHHLIAFRSVKPSPLVARDGARAAFVPGDAVRRMVLDDGQNQRLATIAGCGISINSRWAVSHDLAAGRLVHVLPGWRLDEDLALWLVYPRANVLTAKTRVFIDFLVEELAPGLREQASDAH